MYYVCNLLYTTNSIWWTFFLNLISKLLLNVLLRRISVCIWIGIPQFYISWKRNLRVWMFFILLPFSLYRLLYLCMFLWLFQVSFWANAYLTTREWPKLHFFTISQSRTFSHENICQCQLLKKFWLLTPLTAYQSYQMDINLSRSLVITQRTADSSSFFEKSGKTF